MYNNNFLNFCGTSLLHQVGCGKVPIRRDRTEYEKDEEPKTPSHKGVHLGSTFHGV